MAVNKCKIVPYALQNLNQLIYGYGCQSNVGCKINLNYVEYLNCTGVDIQPCETVVCDFVPVTVNCTMQGVTLEISDITINSVRIDFTYPEHDYTIVVTDGVTPRTFINPLSPLLLNDLIPDTQYEVTLTQFCPYGQVRFIEEDFTTLIACVDIDDIEYIAEDIPDV